MTINIRTITNADMYTYGEWISEIIYNSTHGFPSGITSEWGYLAWDEENIGTGYDGLIRIDILNTDGTTIISDIIKNSDGTPTDLSATSVATMDIKIKVKLYGKSEPTPKLSNLRINYKNWSNYMVFTNTGKNVVLNRLGSVPTTTEINSVVFGNSETSFSESTSGLTNNITPTPYSFTASTFNELNATLLTTTLLSESDSQISNGTSISCIGLQTTDTTPYFCGAIGFSDIVKNSLYRYYFKVKFKLVAETSLNSMITLKGKNMIINRTFKSSPDYTSPIYYVLGTTSTLSSDMLNLSSVLIGPSSFTYNALDTISHRYVQRATLDKSTGNGQIFNAVGDLNSSSDFYYAGKTFEDMYKTETYVFMYTINNNLKTPASNTE